MIAQKPEYHFSKNDSQEAFDDWGANCGPTALAMCIARSLKDVKPIFDQVGFPQKKYTNPTMMEDAVRLAGRRIVERARDARAKPWANHGLVRIQWTGPWTAPGTNQKWAYGHTHWVHSHRWDAGGGIWIFDCNSGWTTLADWELRTVPLILVSIPRADGGFYSTHVWEVE